MAPMASRNSRISAVRIDVRMRQAQRAQPSAESAGAPEPVDPPFGDPFDEVVSSEVTAKSPS
ncbi:hypothetical protein GCM10022205_60370 [Spinactinospora alkalitolerans]